MGNAIKWLGAHVFEIVVTAMILVALIGLIVLWTTGDLTASTAASASAKCPAHLSSRTNGKRLRRPVKLVPDLPGQTINFGRGATEQAVDVVLYATPALPRKIKSTDLRLVVLRRFVRQSPTLPTRTAPSPRFTDPKISAGRDRVTFTVCLNGSNLAPGSYAGNVLIEGPKGLSSATESITENVRNELLLKRLLITALVAAFAFLALRGAADRQSKHEQLHASAVADATANKQAGKLAELKGKEPAPHLWSYARQVLLDLNWWMTTLVGLGVAAGTVVAAYNVNPSWGADAWATAVTVVGAVFSAVGAQSVVTSLGKPVKTT